VRLQVSPEQGDTRLIFQLSSLALLLASSVSAGSPAFPNCLDQTAVLPVNNEQVLQWKQTSPNGVKRRGHVTGIVTRSFNDRSGHAHFEIKIGKLATDTLEVIYNKEFGALPPIREFMNIEACGDYITSNRPNGGFPASPSGAIIHWIHKSDNVAKHESGYLAIDGTLYGNGNGHGSGHAPESIDTIPYYLQLSPELTQ
jgi:hypothetical protein